MRCGPCTMKTSRRDGYVSLEVSPLLAHNSAATLDEARRLWPAVARDNLMIKVPATPQGIPAVHELISEGISVNVTLLFAQDTYERVAEAYIAGLERHAASGGDLKQSPVLRVSSSAGSIQQSMRSLRHDWRRARRT